MLLTLPPPSPLEETRTSSWVPLRFSLVQLYLLIFKEEENASNHLRNALVERFWFDLTKKMTHITLTVSTSLCTSYSFLIT